MRSIIAFICRALLLALYVVLGRYEYIATPLEVIERAVVTCLQICILGVAWVIFELHHLSDASLPPATHATVQKAARSHICCFMCLVAQSCACAHRIASHAWLCAHVCGSSCAFV